MAEQRNAAGDPQGKAQPKADHGGQTGGLMSDSGDGTLGDAAEKLRERLHGEQAPTHHTEGASDDALETALNSLGSEGLAQGDAQGGMGSTTGSGRSGARGGDSLSNPAAGSDRGLVPDAEGGTASGPLANQGGERPPRT
jgi:hypothetical protein